MRHPVLCFRIEGETGVSAQTAREKEVGSLRSLLFVHPTFSAALKAGQMPVTNHTNDNRRSPYVLAQIRERREL